MNTFSKITLSTTFAAALAFGAVGMTHAAGSHSGGHGHGHHGGPDIGKPGKAANATRTIDVMMHDNYYTPENITVKKGETIRFVVKNMGELVHEFNIGTKASHKAHLAEMNAMMESGVLEADRINMDKMHHGGMTHDDPNSTLLEPGKTGEIVWTFTNDAKLEFACNVPGHYDAGMMGHIRFK